jgi:tetratricopeptide (TPR) repeat protein
LTSLAELYKVQGMFEQAEVSFQRALRIWEQPLLLEHVDGIEALKNFLSLYLLQGKSEQAELLLSHALHIREETLGLDHSVTVMLRQKMDEIHQNGTLKSGAN